MAVAVKIAQLGRGIRTVEHAADLTPRKLLSTLGPSGASTPDVRVDGGSIGLDERIPDGALITVNPRIVAG
jgi:hypothetical protein